MAREKKRKASEEAKDRWGLSEEAKGRLRTNLLPDCKYTVNGNPRQAQPLTAPNLQYVLRHLGLRPRFNMMTHEWCMWRDGSELSDDDSDMARVVVEDTLKRLDVNGTGPVYEMLASIARHDRYHPMEDWLRGLVWDGTDRLDALAGCVKTSSELWPYALDMWLMMVVEGVCNWRLPDEARQALGYCLVLQGRQRLGKTQFFRRVGGRWALTEAEVQLGGSVNAEESQLRTLRHPIVELAELDGITRKQEVTELKAFLTRTQDLLRRKYARSALKMPRMTAFCGTVNEPGFLVDQTGNRRFVVVPVDSIDWAALNAIDMEQIWAQVHSMWLAEGWTGFNEEEEALQRQELEQFMSEPSEVEAVRDAFARYGHDLGNYYGLSVRDYCRALRLPTDMKTVSSVRGFLLRSGVWRGKIMGVKGRFAVAISPVEAISLDLEGPLPPEFAKQCVPRELVER